MSNNNLIPASNNQVSSEQDILNVNTDSIEHYVITIFDNFKNIFLTAINACNKINNIDTRFDSYEKCLNTLTKNINSIYKDFNDFKETLPTTIYKTSHDNQLRLEGYISQKFEDVTHKAKSKFDGYHPNMCTPEQCRYMLNQMSKWHNYNFNTPFQYFYEMIYNNYAARYHRDIRVYHGMYIDIASKLISKSVCDKISKLAVAYNMGFINELYSMAWELTQGGTVKIPECLYQPIDLEKYPHSLVPINYMAGTTLFDDFINKIKEKPMGRVRKKAKVLNKNKINKKVKSTANIKSKVKLDDTKPINVDVEDEFLKQLEDVLSNSIKHESNHKT